MADEERIVVMGGSFNPPTLAHALLMEEAMHAVGAARGIFVPVSDAYIAKKLRGGMRIGAQMRLAMLTAMCAGRPELCVSGIETESPGILDTNETMRLIQTEYPGAALYFLAGADKLPMLRALADETNFFERFGVVLCGREGVGTRRMIESDAACGRFADAFVHVEQPEGARGVSSSAVRGMIARGEWDGAARWLDGRVLDMLRGITEGGTR